MRPRPKTFLELFAWRALTLIIGCSGLVWGVFALQRGEVADTFRDIESRLLHFQTFGRTTSMPILESAAQHLSACDTHAQRALLLIEVPLAEASLRSGATREFDRHIRALEVRSKQILSCAPREAFVWLLMFNLEVLHGSLDEHSFNLLAMSYATSPNEAWVSIRRILVAMPLVLVAPEPARLKILNEFQKLIRDGFVDEAARAYLSAPAPARPLLQTRIEQLNAPQQKVFSDALQKFRV